MPSSLRSSYLPVLLLILTSSVLAHAQKACDAITPAVLAADAVPAVTRVPGASCSFVTQERWRGQSQPGVLEIIPAKVSGATPEDFDKLQKDWLAQHGRQCGLEVGLGRSAAWCGTGSVDSLDYQLLILRGSTISVISLHNWVRPPNPSRAMARRVALDVFGPVSVDAPLARPE
jgi:hypothetical protein